MFFSIERRKGSDINFREVINTAIAISISKYAHKMMLFDIKQPIILHIHTYMYMYSSCICSLSI